MSTIPRQTPVIPIQDRARGAFFTHYVLGGVSKTYDVLQPLYNQYPADKHLLATVDAVSLAFFTFHDFDPRTAQITQQKYSSALPLLNQALKDPESATSDSTLTAVLLLDLFEKLTSNSPESIDTWMGHENGALALIRMRDISRLQHYIGLKLSIRLAINLLISCIAAEQPVPPALAKLRSDIEPYMNKDDPKWQSSGLSVKYANLRGAVTDGRLSTQEIITRATELDREYVALMERMSPEWHPVTVHLEKPSKRVFDRYYHT